MHGADSDIPWLQRDFGIYVVNLFDTGRASRALSFPSAGLAYLLSKFAGVTADKRHQLSDWRQRPLSDDMLAYARSDTHYLLDIYDKLLCNLDDVCQVSKEFTTRPTFFQSLIFLIFRKGMAQFQLDMFLTSHVRFV